jgi:hypothetical protein
MHHGYVISIEILTFTWLDQEWLPEKKIKKPFRFYIRTAIGMNYALGLIEIFCL